MRRREGRSGAPVPAEVLLVVEVANTSLAYDRERKLPLYAEAGIPEAWIMDLGADAVEIYSQPGPGGYGRKVRIGRGERLISATAAGLAFDVAEALPPEG